MLLLLTGIGLANITALKCFNIDHCRLLLVCRLSCPLGLILALRSARVSWAGCPVLSHPPSSPSPPFFLVFFIYGLSVES